MTPLFTIKLMTASENYNLSEVSCFEYFRLLGTQLIYLLVLIGVWTSIVKDNLNYRIFNR